MVDSWFLVIACYCLLALFMDHWWLIIDNWILVMDEDCWLIIGYCVLLLVVAHSFFIMGYGLWILEYLFFVLDAWCLSLVVGCFILEAWCGCSLMRDAWTLDAWCLLLDARRLFAKAQNSQLEALGWGAQDVRSTHDPHTNEACIEYQASGIK